MTIEHELATLRRRLRRLQLGFAAVGLAATVSAACGAYYADSSTPSADPAVPSSLDELTVERLNIREPDGTLRLVLSNKARAPDPVIGGKSVEGRAGGNDSGLVFYDENGNESGGLIYGGKVRKGSGTWFAFDRHDQDQTIAMGYSEGAGGKYEAGMYIWDRPEATGAELMPKWDELRALPAGPERDAFLAQMAEAGELERSRMFLGRDSDATAMLELADGQARPRLRARVDRTGQPRIEFLDETGAITYALTPDGPGPVEADG